MRQPHKSPSFQLNFLVSVMISLMLLPATAMAYGIYLIQATEPAAALKAKGDQVNQEGVDLYRKGDLATAIEKFKEAYQLSEQAKDQRGMARALHNIGQAHSSMGQQHKEEALNHLNRALPLWRAINDHAEEGKTLASIALVYYHAGEKPKALKFFEEALPLVPEAWKRNNEPMFLNSMGESYIEVGERQKALDVFLRLLPLVRASNKPAPVAAITTRIAVLYDYVGDSTKAFDYAKQARELWQAIHDRSREAGTLSIMASISERLGNYKEAFAYLTEGVSLLDSPADRSRKADFLIYLGVYYRAWGDDQRSIEYFQQSLTLWKALGLPEKEARTLVEIARSYRVSGMNESALERLSEALRLLGKSTDPEGEMNALYEQGEVYSDLGDGRKAVDSLERALPLARVTGNRITESLILRNLGNVYSTLGDRQKSLENLRQAIALSEAVTDPEFKAHLLAQVGFYYLSLRDHPQQAIDYYSRALDLHRIVGNKEGVSIALTSIALAHEMRGDLQQALKLYHQAIAAREEIRTSARLEEIQLGVAGQSFEVYRLATHLSMRLRQFSQAFELSERARARNFLDQLSNSRIDLRKGTNAVLIEQERTLHSSLSDFEKRVRKERAKPLPQNNSQTLRSLEAELLAKQQEYDELLSRIRAVHPEYDSLRNMNPLTLPEVQRLLNKDTVLVSYFVQVDKTVAFIIARDSFQALEIPTGEEALKREVGLFLNSRSDLKAPQPETLKRLYAQLVGPLKPYLKARAVGIIPHGVLHYLPFAALNDGKNYFGDEHTLFYLPSASVIPFIRKNRKQGGENLLAMAQDRAESLPVLSYANQSAETVARLFNTKALIGRAATESAFRSRAGGSRTLFLAAHGALHRSKPLFSRIYLEPDGENDGILEVHEVYGLNLAKTDLVVLSGCQTQLGARGKGDDIVGLNRAFIYAGTPTVIASLWSVQDKQTGELMVSFFKHLRDGKSKAEALKEAQRETRAKYPHPYHWAAFVLTGDPGEGPSASQTRNRRE
jgi:CHAT domain-containing protein